MTRDRQGLPGGPPRRLAGRALLAVASALVVVAGPLTLPAQAAPSVPVAAQQQQASPDRALRGDHVRDEQWQLEKLRAKTAWRTSTGRGVVVAVIDSGVDASHPDLAGQVLPGLDLVEPDGSDGPDPVGHGTTVAGLIAGRADDDRGVVGLAPDAKILPVRVLDAENRYDDALIIAKAVRWAVDNGAQVVNLSLGGSSDSAALAAALDYAFARDVVVVACTGNLATSTTTKVWYPAREPGVLAVAGLERSGENLWSGSITGHETVLSAPATALYGARPEGGYWRVQGTSFAAPLVAATAALVRSRYPKMSAGDVVNRLISTARDLGPTGRDDRFGYGLVDPVAALTADVPSVGHNPLDDNDSPGVVGFGPAPGDGRDTRAAAAGRGGDPLGRAPEGWSALPAGQTVVGAPERLWSGLALFVALITGSALMVRRFRQVRR
ncbi:type VII secretion-associated serine protease mycosin [Micromonospora sp. C32]|nr:MULTISPECIES: type VII secretion-associated serine protease mycosin [unclassified Micromonospora]MBQ1042860.1 type VII secretion-associated serine protease mycosin [Micromonospora sp. C72]MBQ1057933.1 type VII secretion-associated serine protease mycosin [Micromonospora sp. C32]